MQPEQFRHQISLRVRFADVDMMGHVNNARYITYLEEARLAYAREVLAMGRDSRQVGMILARTEIDYLLPMHEGDLVQVWTRCTRLGHKSFDLGYLLLLESSQQAAASALTTMVAYDYAAAQSMPLPSGWRQSIQDFEKVAPAQSS